MSGAWFFALAGILNVASVALAVFAIRAQRRIEERRRTLEYHMKRPGRI